MIIYIFQTILFFLFILFIRNKSTDFNLTKLDQLKDVVQSNRIIGFIFAINLFSMAGLPPLAGFFTKFNIFAVLIKDNNIYILVLMILVSCISAFYYIKIIQFLFFNVTEKPKFYYTPSYIIATIMILITFLNVFFCCAPFILMDILYFENLTFFMDNFFHSPGAGITQSTIMESLGLEHKNLPLDESIQETIPKFTPIHIPELTAILPKYITESIIETIPKFTPIHIPELTAILPKYITETITETIIETITETTTLEILSKLIPETTPETTPATSCATSFATSRATSRATSPVNIFFKSNLIQEYKQQLNCEFFEEWFTKFFESKTFQIIPYEEYLTWFNQFLTPETSNIIIKEFNLFSKVYIYQGDAIDWHAYNLKISNEQSKVVHWTDAELANLKEKLRGPMKEFLKESWEEYFSDETFQAYQKILRNKEFQFEIINNKISVGCGFKV